MNVHYQLDCLMKPIPTAVIFGGIFSAVNVAQGFPLTPRLLAVNMGGLYAYNAVQCPMVAISGRPSLLHNGLAAGGLGALAIQKGIADVPFMDTRMMHLRFGIKPVQLGFLVYGALGMAFGAAGGKRI